MEPAILIYHKEDPCDNFSLFFGTEEAETQNRQSETQETKKTSSSFSSSDLTWAPCIHLETHQLCQIHWKETIRANWNSFPSVSLSLSHTKTGN